MAHKPGSYIAIALPDGLKATARVMPRNQLELLDLVFDDVPPTLTGLQAAARFTTLWVLNEVLSPYRTKRIAYSSDGVENYVRPERLHPVARPSSAQRPDVVGEVKTRRDYDWWLLQPDRWLRPIRATEELKLEVDECHSLGSVVERLERCLAGDTSRPDSPLWPDPWLDPDLVDRPMRWFAI